MRHIFLLFFFFLFLRNSTKNHKAPDDNSKKRRPKERKKKKLTSVGRHEIDPKTDYVIQLVTSPPIHSLPHTFLSSNILLFFPFFFFSSFFPPFFSFSETLGDHGASPRSYDKLAYDRVSTLN